MTEHMGVVVELWPVAADNTGIWLISGNDAWRSGRVSADDEPHSELDYLLWQNGLSGRVRLVHSTSWRVNGPHVVLTYIAVVAPDHLLVKDNWRHAVPISPAIAEAVGPAKAAPAKEPPTPRHIDVLLHAIRHLRFLQDNDATARDALTGAWPMHLANLAPALAGMYSEREAPANLSAE